LTNILLANDHIKSMKVFASPSSNNFEQLIYTRDAQANSVFRSSWVNE